MKRFKTILLSICMIITLFTSVGITASAKDIYEDKVGFYVQIDGNNLDKDGQISSQPTKYFTGVVYESSPVDGAVAATFPKEATIEDWSEYVADMPDDDIVFDRVKAEFAGKSYIKAHDGSVVSWKRLTSENYRMYWYVFKYERYDGWHVDGVIVDRQTEKEIGVIIPDDPADIPPEATADPEDSVETPPVPEYDKPYELTNNYAYIFGRTDTLMQPEDGMTRGEVAAVLHRLLKQNDKLSGFAYDIDAEPKFKDVKGRWDRSALEYMEHLGLYEPGTVISPDKKITRGEAFRMMAVALGFTSDTAMNTKQYAAILVDAGYIEGDDDGNLTLDETIERCQVCKIYNKIINRTDMLLETADGEEITADTYGFTDLDENAWYYEDVLLGTSAFDGDYVSLELRGARNELDDYSVN